MEDVIRKGSVCRFDPTLDTSGLSKELRTTYKKMKRLAAEYYIVLRVVDGNSLLCVPVHNEKCSHYTRLVINSKSYYAEYLTFLAVQAGWLIREQVHIANPLAGVDKIYEMHKAHTLNVLERKRKKEEQKRDEKRLRKEIQASAKGTFPKEKPSAAVAWNMTHPFQGGRTGSK